MWVVIIITPPILYAGIIVFLLFIGGLYFNHKFSRTEWFRDKEKRYKLSKNIIESKMLIGKTKKEVKETLGDEQNSNLSNNWIYYLGFRPGFMNIDSDALFIEFKNDKVIKVEQYER